MPLIGSNPILASTWFPPSWESGQSAGLSRRRSRVRTSLGAPSVHVRAWLSGRAPRCHRGSGEFDSRSPPQVVEPPCGEIGRRTGFRFRRLRVCRFEACRGDQQQARRPQRGGCSSVGRASGCGPDGRGFEPHRSPLWGRAKWKVPCWYSSAVEQRLDKAQVGGSNPPADTK